MEGDPVIPAPDADDDDDVAWALQTAAIQWQRGQRADAVVWLRRAVEASITAGRAERTRSLTRLAASVADRLVSEALAVPDSKAPPSPTAKHDSDVDELLARSSAPPRGVAPRSSSPPRGSTRPSEIPVDFDADDAEIVDDDVEDDLDDFEDDFDEDASPTIPPSGRAEQSSVRHELSSREYEYEEGATYDPNAGRARRPTVSADDVDYLDLDDTESIVDENELLSDRPPPRPSTIPGVAPEGRVSDRRRSHAPQGSRPPESAGARSPSQRASSSSLPADRKTALSWPPTSTSSRPAVERPTSSSRPPARAAARTSSERPASSSRPPASAGARPSTSSRPPENAGTSNERARSPSDRPIEPIVTAEELFRQRALAGAKKVESSPPVRSSSSGPPPKPKSKPSPAPPVEAPARVEPPQPSQPELAIVDEVSLETVRGFEDLPETSQLALARSAVLTTLSTDEEVGSFGAALVTRGRVGIMPSIADISASVAKPGEVVFTRGTLSEGVSLRVVALESQTVVASWSEEALGLAMADCPWVADELRLVADRFQSQAGAVLGPLGDRLDDVLRDLVLSRLEVRAFAPGEAIVEEGKTVPGLHIVGAGRVDVSTAGGAVTEASPGDLLFGAEVLGAGKAHASARAGKTGALILFAPRATAHELLLSVPPLIEMLAD